MARETRITRRKDEPDRENAFQVIFRTNERLCGSWSSLRGLCKKFGHNESSPELFREVVMPAMKAYVSRRGYVDAARKAKAL